jgi:hypothetical protein
VSKSATALGQLYGVTGQVMNVILKELGYLEGDPGAYAVTEKGTKYAFENDHHRGPGGYSWYNRDWATRSWADDIVDNLDVTDDLKHKAQETVSAARATKRATETVVDEIGAGAGAVADNAPNGIANWKKVAAVAALAGSAYGAVKAAPHAKRLLDEKVVPGLKSIKDKVLRKSGDDFSSEPSAADPLPGDVAADQAG